MFAKQGKLSTSCWGAETKFFYDQSVFEALAAFAVMSKESNSETILKILLPNLGQTPEKR